MVQAWHQRRRKKRRQPVKDRVLSYSHYSHCALSYSRSKLSYSHSLCQAAITSAHYPEWLLWSSHLMTSFVLFCSLHIAPLISATVQSPLKMASVGYCYKLFFSRLQMLQCFLFHCIVSNCFGFFSVESICTCMGPRKNFRCMKPLDLNNSNLLHRRQWAMIFLQKTHRVLLGNSDFGYAA